MRPSKVALLLLAAPALAAGGSGSRIHDLIARRFNRADRRFSVTDARQVVSAARRNGITPDERRVIQSFVDHEGDRADPKAQDVLATVARRNSLGALRARMSSAARSGVVSGDEARAIGRAVVRDGFTAAERRELLRLAASTKLSPQARRIFELLRTTPDRFVPDPYDQSLPMRPQDPPNRFANPLTGGRLIPIHDATPLYDGAWNLRGTVSGSVQVNYGQRRFRGSASYVYAQAVWITTPSGQGMGASGWIPESALATGPLTGMPTIDAPEPRLGDSARTYRVTGGDPALNARWEREHLKVARFIPKTRRVAATDYLLRAGSVVNLLYNCPDRGGIATDTVPVGSTFVAAKGVPEVTITLYKPSSAERAGHMTFLYGRVGSRYGWMAWDALDHPAGATPPPSPTRVATRGFTGALGGR